MQSAIQAKNHGTKSTLLIASGSLIGQAAMLAAMPLLTRMYTPEDMGLYATFTALAGVAAVIVALHYELAIPLPKSEFVARAVAKLACMVAVVVSLLSVVVFALFETPVLEAFNAASLAGMTGWVSVSLALAGVTAIATAHAVRHKAFRATALSKATGGVAQSAVQLLGGVMGLGVSSLIVGAIIGQGVSLLSLTSRRMLADFRAGWLHCLGKYRFVAKRYKNFPLAAAPSSLVNSLAAHLPLLMLAATFDPMVVGFFALSFRVLQAPVKFLGNSLAPVYFGLAASARHDGTLAQLTASMWRTQFVFCLYSFTVLGLVAPEAFALVFGESWREAGVFTQYLTPWIMATFLTTSMGTLVSVLEKQAQELAFQVLYLGFMFAALLAGTLLADPLAAIALFGAVGALLLSGKMIWLLRLANVSVLAQLRVLRVDLAGVSLLALVVVVIDSRALGDGLFVVTCGVLLAAIHGVNYFVRKSYAF